MLMLLKKNLNIPKLVLAGGGKNDYKQKVKDTIKELNLESE